MTSLDILAAIGLTASAAIVVATLAVSYPAPAERRIAAVLGLAAWFVLLVASTALDLFHPMRGFGTAGLGLALVLPTAVVAYTALATTERRRAVAEMPLAPLIGVHAIRVLGIGFILLYEAGRLPAPFAPIAGWGDIAIGLTALPVAWAVAHRLAGWRGLAIVWSLLGTLDLVTAIGLGVTSAPDSPIRLFYAGPDTSTMTTLPWILIPAYLVPILFLLHGVVLARLLGQARETRDLGTERA
jgi:hypothetical protein